MALALAPLGLDADPRPFEHGDKGGFLELRHCTEDLAHHDGRGRVADEGVGTVGGNQLDAEAAHHPVAGLLHDEITGEAVRRLDDDGAGRTPNIDKIAKEGMLFTDYYAEASCTAGRANFITGELPIRTGMTTVGQAGASTGLPAEAVTIATVLKSMGYATGQFGARTTSATRTSSCLPSMASMNSSATCITSMRWKIPPIPITHRTC